MCILLLKNFHLFVVDHKLVSNDRGKVHFINVGPSHLALVLSKNQGKLYPTVFHFLRNFVEQKLELLTAACHRLNARLVLCPSRIKLAAVLELVSVVELVDTVLVLHWLVEPRQLLLILKEPVGVNLLVHAFVEGGQELRVDLVKVQSRSEDAHEGMESHLASSLLEVLVTLEDAVDVGHLLRDRLQ